MSEDIIVRLERWPNEAHEINNWGPQLNALLADAVAEIKRLRALAGAVTPGESFGEIRDATKKPRA